jgi:pimeloyl-ACP methyl ester carboxylesterase
MEESTVTTSIPSEERPAIVSADGHRVCAVHLKSSSDCLVILSHGISTDKNEEGIYSDFARFLSPAFDSLRFDFRGHGESDVPSIECTVMGEVLDLMAVLRWARSLKYVHLLHLATSFGASVTLLAMSKFQPIGLRAIAFWNPVISYKHTFIEPTVSWARAFFNHADLKELAYRRHTLITDTEFEIGPKMAMELIYLDPAATAWPRSLPLLVVHGENDSVVPYKDSAEYARRSGDCVELSPIPGVDHGFDNRVSEVFQLTAEWFRKQVA